MWLAVIVLVSGCDLVFSLDRSNAPPIDGPGGDGSSSDAPPRPTCFDDTFAAGVGLDTTKWSKFEDPNTSVTVDGQLVLSLDSTASAAYAGVQSVVRHDLRSATVEVAVQMPVVSPFQPGIEVYLAFNAANGSYYQVGIDGPRIYIEIPGPGQTQVGNYSTLDPVRGFRIEHVGSELVFSVRTETSGFVQASRISAPLPLDAIQLELAAGTYVDFEPAGAARFDNLAVFCP